MNMQIKWVDRMLPCLALLATLLLGSSPASAQLPGFDGVTYGQPTVIPGEFNGDLSLLPPTATTIGAPRFYRPRLRGPATTKFLAAAPTGSNVAAPSTGPLAPMPSPIQNFAGVSFNDSCTGGSCGDGWPPDPNGDVGPNHYVEAVNSSIAIFSKTGTRLAAFTENQLWSGVGSTPCNGNSQGDPIVVYDWLADRFILSWFAFASNNGPFYQCFAASKTSDPVAGGWWLFPVRMDPGGAGLPPVGDLNDYSKVGLWHDCLYMGANEFAGNNYDGVLFASFNRTDLYSGAPLRFSLGWLPPATNAFTIIPSNNQGKGANAAQPGTPNYYVSESGSSPSFEVRTFTAGANCGAGGVLSAATNVSQAAYTFQQGNMVPQPNTTNKIDMIDDRIMQKVQYRKIGGTESLWVTHPVGASSGKTAMQWAQIDVTGGTIATTPVQQQIYPANSTLYHWMGSVAVDSQGNMALGYSTSNGTAPNFPSIAYSGRLATDPLNTLPQTEVQMIAGAGSQKNTCGGAPCHRCGDYSAMSVDPADDCTFWYINEYYSSQTNGTSGNWQTRIGSFKFPSCTGLPPTTTVVNGVPNASNVGQSVTFTATVTGSSPTGSVAFTDGANTIGTCSAVLLNSGSAQCSTSALTAGVHTIQAAYSGDPNNAQSSGTTQQTVIGLPTSTAVVGAPNPSSGGQSVTFTATVTGTSPTGTVTFTDGANAIVNCSGVLLTSGTAKCVTSALSSGVHTINAAYSGDATNASSSGSTQQTVNGPPPPTTTKVVSSLNPSPVGQSVTFTATVTGAAPTGSVSFTDGTTAIAGCTGVLLGGGGNSPIALCTTSALARGMHTIRAKYSGDGANATSTGTVVQKVRR
jgi:hypothetical protein